MILSLVLAMLGTGGAVYMAMSERQRRLKLELDELRAAAKRQEKWERRLLDHMLAWSRELGGQSDPYRGMQRRNVVCDAIVEARMRRHAEEKAKWLAERGER